MQREWRGAMGDGESVERSELVGVISVLSYETRVSCVVSPARCVDIQNPLLLWCIGVVWPTNSKRRIYYVVN